MIFELSDPTVGSDIIGGRAYDVTNLSDFESGGDDINDLTHGKMSQVWSGYYEDSVVYIRNPNIEPVALLSSAGITELSFTFDQLMRPVLAFVSYGEMKLRWYDSTVSDFIISEFPLGYSFPRISLDDKRGSQDANSDIIFAYMKETSLCYRAQRDRYEIEYILKTDFAHKLIKIGMNKKWRMQFVFL